MVIKIVSEKETTSKKVQNIILHTLNLEQQIIISFLILCFLFFFNFAMVMLFRTNACKIIVFYVRHLHLIT